MRRREWIGLAVIAFTCLLYSIDVNVVELAIQKLTLHLGPSNSQHLWIMDIFGFLLAGFLITMGNSGDRIGPPPSEPPWYSLLTPAPRRC